jgi:hypothetical protein
MKKVYVYYEENHGDLLCEGNDACEDIKVFADLEKAKSEAVSVIREYAGTDELNCGSDCYVVEQEALDEAGIIVGSGDKLSDEQITEFVNSRFTDDGGSIMLFYGEQDNYCKYFIINIQPSEVVL